MKRALLILAVVSMLSAGGLLYNNSSADNLFIAQQVSLDGNNIKSYIWNTGVFDQNLAVQNTPGFEWPKGTGHYAIFTAGLSIGAYVNNGLRLATASYKGEYRPGYCINGIFYTESRFRHYRVTRGDNFSSNPDWANWGLMVPFGAPFIDHNNNGTYEPTVDTPGVKGAAQTIFICLTDADPTAHTNSEGFSGGTEPLGAEVHLTAWCYDNPGYADMQFFKWNIINKSNQSWDSIICTILSDADLGFSDDDSYGCDSTRNLGYCYNWDNNDDGNSYAYGLNPPAVGIMFLNCSGAVSNMTSYNYQWCTSCPTGTCDRDPSYPSMSYWFMKGFKNDGTPYVIPGIHPPRLTKYNFSGDPESNSGWTEYLGKINNCGGSITDTVVPAYPSDVKFIMSSRLNNILPPGEAKVVQICQLIARGNSNLNSVTKLKQLADVAKNLCQNGFVIGVTPISTQVPNSFVLYQNYPNPFNPTTKIRFSLPNPSEGRAMETKLTIYDALGREVATLVNEQLNPGTYETEWDATNYPSGVYFYKLEARQVGSLTGDFTMTRKLVLLK